MVRIRYRGAAYECGENETVLDALLRQRAEIAYSCKKGTCLTCMVRAVDGPIGENARVNLKPALAEQGYFLACQCRPEKDLTVAPPDEAAVFGRVVVRSLERLAPDIVRVILEPSTPLYYRAGQFINLRRRDKLQRSYSLASVPSLDAHLEVHVKRMRGGQMSNWIFDTLKPGDELDFQGPNGQCFYIPGRRQQGMILVGTGTGLAPLMGVVRDALAAGHSGPIHLYHGSSRADGLYLRAEMQALAGGHENFHYTACVSAAAATETETGFRRQRAEKTGGFRRQRTEKTGGFRRQRADQAAFADQPDLSGWRVFLCGYPAMVNGAKKNAYLAGAATADIHADPFDFADLRTEARQGGEDKPDVW